MLYYVPFEKCIMLSQVERFSRSLWKCKQKKLKPHRKYKNDKKRIFIYLESFKFAVFGIG